MLLLCRNWRRNSSYISKKKIGSAFGNVKLSVGVQTRVWVQAQLVPDVFLVASRTWVQLKLPDSEKSTYPKYSGRAFLLRAKELLCFLAWAIALFSLFPPPSSHLRHILMLMWAPPISCYCVSYYRLPSLQLRTFSPSPGPFSWDEFARGRERLNGLCS